MNEIIINDKPLPVKEYKGNRVVTFKEIDAVHGRKDGTARKRFNDNKKRFIEGVDYFVRKTDEAAKEYGITAPNGLILITESGYLMLAKSFTDDLAWTVQRELVNFYFRGRSPAPVSEQPALETSEYSYTPKTYKGEPVITLADFEHFTRVKPPTARYVLKNHCEIGRDYYIISKSELIKFKNENPCASHMLKAVILLTKRGVRELLEIYKIHTEIPMTLERKPPLPGEPHKNEPLPPREPTIDELLTSLDVIRYVRYMRSKTAQSLKTLGLTGAAESSRNGIKACDNMIKEIASFISL